MIVRIIKKACPACLLVLGSWLSLVFGEASASLPWWHVNTISAPAVKAGDESQIVLEVSNLGDAPSTGLNTRRPSPISSRPVSPPTESSAKARRQILSNLHELTDALTECSIAGQTVTCTFSGLLPYEHLSISMFTQVAPGAGDGVSEVSVSGGGAPAVDVIAPLALNDSSPSYGIETMN